jgi:hypothetical protein
MALHPESACDVHDTWAWPAVSRFSQRTAVDTRCDALAITQASIISHKELQVQRKARVLHRMS